MLCSTTSRFSICVPVACLALLVGPASAQQLAKRLTMKDGSYQLATKWEVQGERVRYFSPERNEWEEVPASMVDWAATEKYAMDRAAGAPLPEALSKELANERVTDEDKAPEVSPGLRLPGNDGVLLLDTFDNRPQLVPLEQREVKVSQNGKVDCMNFVCSDPNLKDDLNIAGPHAEVQAHVSPVLYIKLGQRTAGTTPLQELANRFQIVHVRWKKDHRIVGTLKVSMLGMAVPAEQKSIPARVQQISEGWLKMTPADPLPVGEYALIEVMDSRKAINLNMGAQFLPDNVWDFGGKPVGSGKSARAQAETSLAAPLAVPAPTVQ